MREAVKMAIDNQTPYIVSCLEPVRKYLHVYTYIYVPAKFCKWTLL